MKRTLKILFSTFMVTIFFIGCGGSGSSSQKEDLAFKITTNEEFILVKERAKELISLGFTAGDGYDEIWIRDFNTFMELSCDVLDNSIIREKLLTFFSFQGTNGNIVDAYISKEQITNQVYDYIYSDIEPTLAAHKNTVETDQESSLLQAVYKYIQKTGAYDLLEVQINGITVAKRMESALEYLMNNKYNNEYGLIWGATTADWGDVQPEDDWGVLLTSESHHAFDIYDNAMLVIAMKNFIELVPASSNKWNPILEELEVSIRKHLWDEANNKFYPHIYLNGSPFPDNFTENEIFYSGGTALAIEAGLLSNEEIKISLNKMIENVNKAQASSLGLTLYPAYPNGLFENPIMSSPYTYQNGGDWTWFGARMIQQLVLNGFVEEAYEQILPMTTRVIKNNGFYEWYNIDNEPQGSSSYRGSAGVLYKAILLLDSWAGESKKILKIF